MKKILISLLFALLPLASFAATVEVCNMGVSCN